jgi:hypothetical protein
MRGIGPVNEPRQRGSAEGKQRKRESRQTSPLLTERKSKVVRSSAHGAQTYNSVAPESSVSRFVFPFLTHTANKKKCRGSSGRDALRVALECMTKTDDKLVTMLLQNKDVVDVNAILASPRYQAVYGHAFAEAVRENGSPHLDPKTVLRALTRCREAANAELVYALILHPKNTPEEAFLGACTWEQWKIAEGFAPVMVKFVVQRALQDAQQS